MENEKPAIKPIAINYGIYLGVLTIASLIILYVLNIESHWIASVLSTVITIIIFFYGISEYKKLKPTIKQAKPLPKRSYNIYFVLSSLSLKRIIAI